MNDVYNVIGVMSGTSLDGLDLAFCTFHRQNTRWEYTLKIAETIEYTNEWKERLKNAIHFSGMDLALLNVDYGHFLGERIRHFIEKNHLHPDLISVHGHTIFHQPEKRLTLQIGDGSAIATYVQCPVVTQFRNVDVALGGQGAPLVPIGDHLLFHTADFRLNLGGIANISFLENKKTHAFDICVCNMALNDLSASKGFSYDADGSLAASGQVNHELLALLNGMDFFKQSAPKSLGVEWFNSEFQPILKDFKCSVEDKLRTVCEHIAKQISAIVNVRSDSNKQMIVTGGGARNTFLMSCIKQHCHCQILETNPNIIDFKEALIFAFLGVLRMRGEVNCLSDVTGAKQDNIGGCVFLGQR